MNDRADIQRRLEAFTQGTLTPEERRALETLAEHDAAVREALEAHRPLGAATRDKIVDHAQREIRSDAMRRTVWRAGTVLAACAAAAVAVFIGGRDPALPRYSLSLSGGDQPLRGGEPGAAGGVPMLEPASQLTITLRPDLPALEEVALRVFERRGSELSILELRAERSQQGAFKIEGLASELFPGKSGELELWFAVGRPRSLPSPEAVSRALERGEHGRLLSAKLHLAAP